MLLFLVPVVPICEYVGDGALLLFILLLAVKEGVPLHEDPVCGTGHYLNNNTCTLCSVCPEGHGVEHVCDVDKDTVCQSCTEGQYSKLVSGNRVCTVCTNCSNLNRGRVSNCTKERDAVCGSCNKGYFLQISRDGSTYCAECSLCPPDEEAVRWYECADMPESQQCAPGYYQQSTAEPVMTNPRLQDIPWDIAFAELASNRTVFLPVALQEEPAEQSPWYEALVSALSLFFTLVTVSAFSCALCSLYKRVRRSRFHS